MLMEHVSPAYVQKQLGHHSITMTVDTYGHWIPGEGRDQADSVWRSQTPNAKRRMRLVMVDSKGTNQKFGEKFGGF